MPETFLSLDLAMVGDWRRRATAFATDVVQLIWPEGVNWRKGNARDLAPFVDPAGLSRTGWERDARNI